ncbi:MAG: VTC domain-containing protein [Lachnospiraceae bacterium]
MIDQNIRSRYEKLDLGYDGECQVLDPDSYLMEIKVPDAYPMWLADLLCELKIYPVSFSKYGTVYSNSIRSGEITMHAANLGSMYELKYHITLKNAKKEKEMIDQLRCRNGNLTIICGKRSTLQEEL